VLGVAEKAALGRKLAKLKELLALRMSLQVGVGW
jgi:hypothetical protein